MDFSLDLTAPEVAECSLIFGEEACSGGHVDDDTDSTKDTDSSHTVTAYTAPSMPTAPTEVSAPSAYEPLHCELTGELMPNGEYTVAVNCPESGKPTTYVMASEDD